MREKDIQREVAAAIAAWFHLLLLTYLRPHVRIPSAPSMLFSILLLELKF